MTTSRTARRPGLFRALRPLASDQLALVAGGEVARARIYFKTGDSGGYDASPPEYFLIEGHTDA